jgi:crotonobetainyl-CoA:carnitine CoA-transferase CaiB-like acyl-CoA transferase
MLHYDHPEIGPRGVPGPAWLASRSTMRAPRQAPCLGEHTTEVLTGVLGMSIEDVERLAADGVLR